MNLHALHSNEYCDQLLMFHIRPLEEQKKALPPTVAA